MTSALSSNTCKVCSWYPFLVVRLSLLFLYAVSGDLDMMPGSLAEFVLEHEFDDHHYFKNAWMRDIIASIVRVSLLFIHSCPLLSAIIPSPSLMLS
jgi:hypothetical protein